MKQFNRYKNQIYFFLITALFSLSGCEEYNNMGIEVLPKGDLVTVYNSLIKDDISAFTFSEDSVRTDEPSKSLIGSLNDSIFGLTTIDFATQFRLFDYPDFGTNAKADSVKLYLYFRSIYGDTLTKNNFKVYELHSGLDQDAKYTQEVDLKSLAYNKLLGEIDYKTKVKIDSTTKDTFYQLIRIPLDISLGQKLISADSLDMVNNDVFLEYFKGLYIESRTQASKGGAILTLETEPVGTFTGSAVVLFYHNDDLKSKAGGDSAQMMPYIISKYSARVNRITHDYSKAPFYKHLNQETVEDSLIYVQATGGLKSRILIDDLTSWNDSVNIAINKAELIFQVDTIASQVKKFQPPMQLLFTVVDSVGNEFLPIDYVFSPTFYGGGLYKDYTYRFNITQHVQNIIEGKAKNYGFYLTSAYKNDRANRVVLKGSTSKTGVKLSITYSRYYTN